MSDNFCIVPWIHLNTEPTGKVKPCCAYFPSDKEEQWPRLQDMPLESIWNSGPQKKLRQKFLRNETPKGCDTCFVREASGSHSMRLAMNERFQKYVSIAKNHTDDSGYVEDFNLRYWDFRFSNICNFKCRMCGHGLSSAWWDDLENKQGLTKILNSDYHKQDLIKYVDQFIDSVEEIYFAGGEPLIMPEHYLIIDKLIEKNRYDVFLRYNTNLSTLKYKNYDLIEIWKRFHKVDIFASLDGTDGNAEYTRSGTDWQRVKGNLEYITNVSKKFPNINLIISSTVHILNVFNFTDIIDEVLRLDLNPRRVIASNLLMPDYLKTALLPDHLKLKLKDKFDNHLETITNEENKQVIKEMYKSIIYYLDNKVNDKDMYDFLENTLRLDKLRNESVHEACPELSEWINDQIKNPVYRKDLISRGYLNE